MRYFKKKIVQNVLKNNLLKGYLTFVLQLFVAYNLRECQERQE